MTALEALKRYFGYNEFRGGQEALISGILAGKDVLGIMPTGAGKSICFQVPSLMMDGVALVVSPLISLMKDQVNALTQSGIAAAYINTSLTQGQIDRALRNARNGAYKLIYVAPERLPTPEFMAFARSVDISMLAVDEAHCISQWGHDFRPSYARIPDFIAKLSKRPVVSAFTATATPKVREDILTQLDMSAPQILITGFDRKNLYFGARKPRNKYDALSAFLKDREGRSGIVYCGTRKYVEVLCKRLRADGYNASCYHAGLPDKERHDNQDDFLRDRAQIMVATNAFGMGIDKSNVSFVVHLNMPKDIESYYQEAGRAGRNGEPADCVLLYSDRDIRMNEWLLENDKETERRQKERSRERMREMISYGTTTDCLRGFILKYFGETPPVNCGNCDRCNAVAVTTSVVDTVKKASKANNAKIADKTGAKKKAVTTKTANKDKPDANGRAGKANIANKAGAKKKESKAKIAGKAGAKKEADGTAYSEHTTSAVATIVKISDKRVSVSMIAERINSYLAPLDRQEVSAVGINEWLASEGYIDTINDNGKNRKISTDKGISAGILTEVRKVGIERVRVNMFDRKAQELVVEKFCGAEAFVESYTKLAGEPAKIELEEPRLPQSGHNPTPADSTAVPGLIRHPHELQEECPAPDEHGAGADAETPPPSVEPLKPPRTIFSIIADALKSFGKIFSKR